MTLDVALKHRFPGLTLDVAFQAPDGLTALFGRSGSGKTTVVNAVAGLLRPDQGRVVVDGEVLLDSSAKRFVPPHLRRVGYVFQDARLFPHLTVRQNLEYGRRFLKSFAPEVPQSRIVDLLGIGPLLDRRPATLSGGEKQRVAFGRAILSNPRFLLMDEPLAALDEPRKAEILPYLERLRDEIRLPILYVSHSVSEVARLATTVVLMDAGRVTAMGPVGDMLVDPAMAPLLGLRDAGAILTARMAGHSDDGLSRLESPGGTLWLPRISAEIGANVRLRVLAQDVMLATIRPQEISALNILSATVLDLRLGDGPGAMVRLSLGTETLLSRITRRSALSLGLTPGKPIFAVLKAVSVAQEDISSSR